jgi:hypothetical protein
MKVGYGRNDIVAQLIEEEHMRDIETKGREGFLAQNFIAITRTRGEEQIMNRY